MIRAGKSSSGFSPTPPPHPPSFSHLWLAARTLTAQTDPSRLYCLSDQTQTRTTHSRNLFFYYKLITLYPNLFRYIVFL